MATGRLILLSALLVSAGGGCAHAATSPTGWDAYRRTDLLPMLRAGEHARLASSYDRRGGNVDGGRFACLRHARGRCVVAEHTGPGEVDSIWSTRPRAGDVRRTGTIRVELDGRTVLDAGLREVAAGTLGAPFAFPAVGGARQAAGGGGVQGARAVRGRRLRAAGLREVAAGTRGAPFAFPAVASARQASGAVWIKAPMAFRAGMRISTSSNPGYVHVNYRTFDSSDGVVPFDPDDPAADVLSALRSGRRPLPDPPVDDVTGRGTLSIDGPGTIGALRVMMGRRPTAAGWRTARVQMTFDGRRTVDAPLGELLGSGWPARVRSRLSATDPDGLFNAAWPMPFRERATVRVRGAAALIEAGVSRAPGLPDALARGDAGYFHATSRRGRTRPGRPWRVLDAGGRGLLVGVSATLEGPRSHRHLEGDERIVADGVAMRGTGTEDFFEGGFYWRFGPRSLPLVGSPAHVVGRAGCARDCRSMYRWLLADAVPWERGLRVTLEHGDRNRVAGTYSTTALWYAP